MVPFVESCPLFRLGTLLLPPLAVPLLLHSVSGCLSDAGVLAVVAEAALGADRTTDDETKSKKSPLVMSSGRNGSPMSIAVDSEEGTATGDEATTTLVVVAITVPGLDDIAGRPRTREVLTTASLLPAA